MRSISPFDPLLASVDLPHTEIVFPLGLPVLIQTNDPAVLDHAALSWGASKGRFDHVPLEFRVLVSDAPCPQELNPPAFRAQKNLMTAVTDSHHFGVCELAGGFGFVHTSKELLEREDFFRYHFLEGLIYSLLDTHYLATIHSACVTLNGRGVLLIGESGAGKSSFAYGCARRKWTYTSDDASSLLLNSGDRTVLGNPNGFRFRPSIAALFPELQGHVRDRNGKPTLEIRTSALPHVTCSEESSIEYVIFLNRESEPLPHASLRPVPQPERYRRLFQPPWPVELSTTASRRDAITRLSEADGFELRYRELDPAIDALEDLVA